MTDAVDTLTLDMLIDDAVVESESESHRVWMRRQREIVASSGNGLRRAWPWPPRVILPSELAVSSRRCRSCNEVYPETKEFFGTGKPRTRKMGIALRRHCRGCVRQRHRNQKRQKVRDNPLEYRFTQIRKGALRRGHAWGFQAPEDLIEYLDAPCHYCGVAVATRLALDRLDSAVGYVPGNVVSCCWTCNRCKVDMTVDEWTAHMERVLDHLNHRSVSEEPTGLRRNDAESVRSGTLFL